jgi:integrase
MSLNEKLRKAERQHAHARRRGSLSYALGADDASVSGKTLRVMGPYPNRERWRLVLIDGTGRQSKVYDSLEEAEAIKARLLAELRAWCGKTVGEALDEYAEYQVKVRGVKPETTEHESWYLRDMLPTALPLASLTAERAASVYLAYAARPNRRNGKPLAVNTHHWVLLLAKCWAKWAVKQGLLSKNPFVAVEPIGRKKAGKVQHTVDEAQRFSAYLLHQASDGDRAAVGVLLMLHLGLRKGEVSARVARDVDADGQILIIPFGKTLSSRRRVRVPQWLQPVLRGLVKDLTPNELLFSVGGRPVSRGYWWRKVGEYCDAAGVPKVCPHSLRGLHATLALEEGATSDAVARALGHANFKMTAKHYASADSVHNARVARAGQLLSPRNELVSG